MLPPLTLRPALPHAPFFVRSSPRPLRAPSRGCILVPVPPASCPLTKSIYRDDSLLHQPQPDSKRPPARRGSRRRSRPCPRRRWPRRRTRSRPCRTRGPRSGRRRPGRRARARRRRDGLDGRADERALAAERAEADDRVERPALAEPECTLCDGEGDARADGRAGGRAVEGLVGEEADACSSASAEG